MEGPCELSQSLTLLSLTDPHGSLGSCCSSIARVSNLTFATAVAAAAPTLLVPPSLQGQAQFSTTLFSSLSHPAPIFHTLWMDCFTELDCLEPRVCHIITGIHCLWGANLSTSPESGILPSACMWAGSLWQGPLRWVLL